MTHEFAIEAKSLRKTYESGESHIVVFDDLWLAVRQGERVAIVGESGSGKSTLLHLLGGLDRPTSGSVHIGAKELGRLSDSETAEVRNLAFGFVWQNLSLLPEFTAVENVAMPLMIRGQKKQDALEAGFERLKEVGLSQRTHHRPGELSGGEQQRVAIARALAGNPQILLADEPTGSLDHRTGESVIDLLMQIHDRHKLTSIYVTHNLSFANRCDRVLELRNGCLQNLSEAEQTAGVVETQPVSDGGTYV